MNKPHAVFGLVLLLFCRSGAGAAPLEGAPIPPWVPDSLRPWIPWVLHGQDAWGAPPRWDNHAQRRPVWPVSLRLDAGETGARFAMQVSMFAEAWVSLPGDPIFWPQAVQGNGAPVPVVLRGDRPAVRLAAGHWTLEGTIPWSNLPPRLRVPPEIGVIHLRVLGEEVPAPSWDNEGWLWFRPPPAVRPPPEQPQPNFLAVDWFGLLEDGNPQWLRVELQISVAGQSREENLGTVLPEGWSLAAVRAPIPALVEDGQLRLQVRPGQWNVELDAFRYGRHSEVRFPAGARVPGTAVLLGLRTRPELRVVELRGAELVDVTQTRFPERWRGLPVYRWETSRPLEVVERQRGESSGAAPAFFVRRQWWLDEDGRGVTFLDHLSAQGLKLWRLDATEGVELGSVRVGDQPQLLTRDPVTGRQGFEIRLRDFTAEAVGRMPVVGPVAGSGWAALTDQVETTLHLPVGWRALAVLGPDVVEGDWLRRWTLLDLFAVLVFALAIQQLMGWRWGGFALVTGVLIHHEPLTRWWIWWGVLILVVLLRLVRTRRAGLVLAGLFLLAALVLGLWTVVFAGLQLRKALYPQLEYPPPEVIVPAKAAAELAGPAPAAVAVEPGRPSPTVRRLGVEALRLESVPAMAADRTAEGVNLGPDPAAKVQTGPAVPEWRWRTVHWRWSGPVEPGESVSLWLIPPWLERILSVLRALFTLGLALLLLRAPVLSWRVPRAPVPPVPTPGGAGSAGPLGIALLLGLSVSGPYCTGAADYPPPLLLNELRDRLLAAPPAFPGAAEIPTATLALSNHQWTLSARIEALAACAVPVPARLTQLSPARVWLNGEPAPALRREDGSVWVAVERGVHEVRMEGLLPPVEEWVWSYLLRPRRVQVDAPGWVVSGIGPEGVPGDQIFLRRADREKTGRAPTTLPAGYGEQPVTPAFLTLRELELGLQWKVRTTVRRLSPPGRPVVVSVPLIAGEQILTGGVTAQEGRVEARFAPGQMEYVWESEIPLTNVIALRVESMAGRAEQWRLQVGQVWSVTFAGLAPVYEAGPGLRPTWYPWPGEEVHLEIRRPQALSGTTVTIESVRQSVQVGHRLRTTELVMQVRSSLGQDFVVTLPDDAEPVRVERDGQSLPIQRVGSQVTIPLVPGRQELRLSWKETGMLGPRIRLSEVRLPVEAGNVHQTIHLPEDRWPLGTRGPRLGPAVQFWSVLVLAALLAVVLSQMRVAPLGHWSWFLLLVGLTQVSVTVAWVVVVWLAALQLRGTWNLGEQKWWVADLAQVILVGLTVAALGVLYAAAAAGLLGRVEMFIAGNSSTTWVHQWFTARTGPRLPQPETWAVSLWWYRVAMLAWALWLALSVLRWLRWGWKQFGTGGCWRWPSRSAGAAIPPPVP